MYARIQNGVVVEMFTPPSVATLAECFHADVAAQFVEVPSGVAPAQGWTYDGKTFAPPPPPPSPTLAQQAAALLAGGLAVTSTATPALNATYPTTQAVQQQVIAEITSILLNGAFADGASTIEWPDVTGIGHAFDVAQFKALASVIAAFVSNCIKCMNGQSATLPSATATIP
jgi:hypothetical protein